MQTTISLDVIDIPTPCPADWDAMHGDARVRHCDHCKLNVYNLSEMTRSAAEALLTEREGRMCIRLYRRADGTVITKDCEGAIRLAARRMSRLATMACAAVLGGLLAPIVARAGGDAGSGVLVQAKQWCDAKANPDAVVKGEMIIGGGQPPVQRVGGMVAVQGDFVGPPATQPTTQPTPITGKVVAPQMGEPLMGAPVPPPPSTQPSPKG